MALVRGIKASYVQAGLKVLDFVVFIVLEDGPDSGILLHTIVITL